MSTINSLLYLYADWKEIARKDPTLEIEKDGQVFYYFGANHSRDPHNEQYPRLKKYWEEFLAKTHEKDHIVLVEGGLRDIRDSEESAIHMGSESDLITLWASRLKIPLFCPEPKRSEEYTRLVNDFTKGEIAYYFFARVVNQWHRHMENTPDFEKYVTGFMKRDQQATGWNDSYFSVEGMKNIHHTLFNADFEKNDKEFFANIVNPTRDDCIINKVPRALSAFRDTHIVEEIVKYWLQGKNIFAIFGGGHVIVQDRALKTLLK